MRENTYLVAVVILIAVVATYFVRKWYAQMGEGVGSALILPRLALECAVFSIIIGLVFIFLRPIQQFIYFQF